MPRSLGDCLESDAGLARYATHAKRLSRFQRAFQSATPLAHCANVVNFKLGKVIIHAANGAVAAKLKQIAPTLVETFRTVAAEVTGIEARVQPRPASWTSRRPGSLPLAHATMTDERRQNLALFANNLPTDSPLREALIRFTR
ncbi:MAG: DciA family protein [Rhodocyclaceae bacterium]|nr:DciA family protein [Rhodocyclaceae bacterium]